MRIKKLLVLLLLMLKYILEVEIPSGTGMHNIKLSFTNK